MGSAVLLAVGPAVGGIRQRLVILVGCLWQLLLLDALRRIAPWRRRSGGHGHEWPTRRGRWRYLPPTEQAVDRPFEVPRYVFAEFELPQRAAATSNLHVRDPLQTVPVTFSNVRDDLVFDRR